MDRETVTLNDLIQTRLSEIVEDLWEHNRVLRVESGEARCLQVGTGVAMERWQCQRTHESGPCGEPLVPMAEALLLLGYIDHLPVLDEELTHEPIEAPSLDPDFGFMISELLHFSDITALQEQYGLAPRGQILHTRKTPEAGS
ncbi:hypothetical protein ABT185_10680 [Streptomyces clavifer]|uniref:hypothetical protein n=1 Tax=Streptomyces clavifer TaxID=68188 RepID=UPI0033216755